ncbi:MAG: pentapeptide repeat-containing protein [Candidatus Altiarchaeia archaeon]
MASKEQLKILSKGVDVWNSWREDNPKIPINLTSLTLFGESSGICNLGDKITEIPSMLCDELDGINLRNANLSSMFITNVDIKEADLSDANLSFSTLNNVNLIDAKFNRTHLEATNMLNVNLTRAELSNVQLSTARLIGVNLSHANLTNGDLKCASLIQTDVSNSIFTGCAVYGISAWDLKGIPQDQSSLRITAECNNAITVENLEVAQFIYLLINNKKIRDIVDSITSKLVLILGRFTPERKKVLDFIKRELRKYGYVPVLFDFEKPFNRDFTETVRTLAHLSKFILVDVSDARSVPQELQAIIPDLQVPVKPLRDDSMEEYGLFSDFQKYPWVLKSSSYASIESLASFFKSEVIEPCESKFKEIQLDRLKKAVGT